MLRLVPLSLLLLAGCRADAPPAVAPVPVGDARAAAPAPDAPAGELRLQLPTSNRALLDGRPDRFYMGLNRTIDSLREERWEGGQYGFVRDPVPTLFGSKTFRRVHEGLDIAPLYRDAAGEPQDTVRAIGAGRVAFANTSAGASSYGRYVVVEHRWSDSPVYSLYAHLDSVGVDVGDTLAGGAPLGRMGYTGRGLGRDRAHVHLEIALLLNEYQPAWFEQYMGGANIHGRFFGTNLAGVNPAELFLALERDPTLTFADFVRSRDEAYVVDLPGDRPLDLLTRYPWLGEGVTATDTSAAGAWRLAFTQEGVPIRVERTDTPVTQPTVDGVSLMLMLTDGSTNRLLHRETVWRYVPSRRGTSYFALIATTAEGAPAW